MKETVDRGLKLAVAGKGGVGKSTLSAALALLLARRGRKVLAVDADPDANLANALGVSAERQRDIIPISQHRALIEDRTGARIGQYGQIFKMNPDVSDIARDYSYVHEGVAILVLGAIEAAFGDFQPFNRCIRDIFAADDRGEARVCIGASEGEKT